MRIYNLSFCLPAAISREYRDGYVTSGLTPVSFHLESNPRRPTVSFDFFYLPAIMELNARKHSDKLLLACRMVETLELVNI